MKKGGDSGKSKNEGPKIMNDTEYEEFLDKKYSSLEQKLKEIENRRSRKVPITLDMIIKAAFIIKTVPVEPLEDNALEDKDENTQDESRLDDSKLEDPEEKPDIDQEQAEEAEGEAKDEGEGDQQIQDETKDDEAEKQDESIQNIETEENNQDEAKIESDAQTKDLPEPHRTADGVTFINSEPTESDFAQLQFMHLEFKDITEISCLEAFVGLESLYLQHNRIAEISGLECLKSLQFLAIQNNLIKELKGLNELESLAFLNISFNKIKQYDPSELPKSIYILKMMNNPCERHMKDYRKLAVLQCENLEEMDNVAVHVSERLHYQGLIQIDLDKQLEGIKQKHIEEELKNKIEDELMEECLVEAGLLDQDKITPKNDTLEIDESGDDFEDLQNLEQKHKLEDEAKQIEEAKKQQIRKENWDSFQRLEEFEDLNRGFTKIKKEIERNRRIVKDVGKQRKKVLFTHYKTLEDRYLADEDKQALGKIMI